MNTRLTQIFPLFTFISMSAYDLFERKKRWMTAGEFRAVIERYHALYGIELPHETLVRVLLESRILAQDGDGAFRFRYSYIYCFFVARFLADALTRKDGEAAARKAIEWLAARLYVRDYANIVIFLVYLTRDERTIASLVAHSKTLYADRKACRFESDVDFINALTGVPPPLHLPPGDPREHKEIERRRLDDHERKSHVELQEDSAEDRELDDVLRVNSAVKTLQILGQILRNFPGALRADVKREIAKESYILGMRTLSAVFDMIRGNLPLIREIFGELVRDRWKISDPRELAEATDRVVFSLATALGVGMVRRVSQATGSAYLGETYADVVKLVPSTAIRVIDVAIKLDHQRGFPEKDVLALAEEVRENGLAFTALRLLVRDHFYLFPVDYTLRQSVCAKLGIRQEDPLMLTGDRRKGAKPKKRKRPAKRKLKKPRKQKKK